jgi:hypothetical protein
VPSTRSSPAPRGSASRLQLRHRTICRWSGHHPWSSGAPLPSARQNARSSTTTATFLATLDPLRSTVMQPNPVGQFGARATACHVPRSSLSQRRRAPSAQSLASADRGQARRPRPGSPGSRDRACAQRLRGGVLAIVSWLGFLAARIVSATASGSAASTATAPGGRYSRRAAGRSCGPQRQVRHQARPRRQDALRAAR